MIKRFKHSPPFIYSARVMRVSLVLSFFLHVAIFFVFQKAFPFHWAVEEFRTYRVELIRPTVEDIDPVEIPNDDVARIKKEQGPDHGDGQDTISLDTHDKRYVTYARLIKEKILRRWKYPAEARRYLIEGKLMALFSLVNEGDMIQVKIIETSGHEILDKEAIRAIRAAAPFPPFPENIPLRRLNIKASFVYRLTAKK